MSASVVVETVTPREHGGDVATELTPVLDALLAQSRPPDEIVVVLVDGEHEIAALLAARHPSIAIAFVSVASYFAMKNAGARASSGDVVALCDGDTLPDPDWLALLQDALVEGVDVAAGRTVYAGDGALLASLSHAGFGIVEDEHGAAENYVINNIAYRRDVLLAHPFEEAIRRDGGCYLQHRSMRRAGVTVRYVPTAIVRHEPEHGSGWLRKHYNRGMDGVQVYRLDAEGLLRGSRWLGRLGPLAVPPIMGRRVLIDMRRLRRARRVGAVPRSMVVPAAVTMLGTRTVELAGGIVAAARRP